MASVRATMFFSMGNAGWTETYVQDNTTPLGIETSARALGSARRKILAANVDLTHIRCSDTLVKRDSRLYEIASGSVKGNNPDTSSAPFLAYICRFDGGDLYRKTVYLRGIPEGSIRSIPGGKMTIDPPLQNDIEKYLDFVKIAKWGFMVRDKVPVDPSNPALLRYGNIANVDNITEPGKVIVTTFNDHNLPQGAFVLISGVKGPRKVNGLHPIKTTVPLGTKAFYLRDFDPTNLADDRIYLGGGVWRAYQLKFVQIDGWDPIKIGHRDTGKDFFSPVGRRRRAKA